MTLRRKRLLLRAAASTLVLTAACLCATAWWPVTTTSDASADPSEGVAATVDSETSHPAIAADEALWKRQLRRPLFDPPPPPPPEVVKAELPPIRARLLGTILEQGNSQAMLFLPSGAVEFRTIGQSLGADDGEAMVVEISAANVKVKRGEELTTLSVEAPAP